MASIKHYYKSEKVYEKCNDRGVTFYDWVYKNVEHYCCSKCGAEVDKNSKFCSKCGVKLTCVREQYKKTTCVICNETFNQFEHENKQICNSCQDLIEDKSRIEIAKTFYNLGKGNK